MNESTTPSLKLPANSSLSVTRRDMLIAGCAICSGLVLRKMFGGKESVFVARNQHYDRSLEKTITDGLTAAGVQLDQLRGKRVLLKPNLVEPAADRPQMTTHPAMIVAAAQVFLRHGAKVKVGEAPGHVRDTELALYDSNVGDALAQADIEFVDMNYDHVHQVDNAGGVSPLTELYLPRAVYEADLVVSMPKLKTHHWMGITCGMKNLYGVLPGIVYGWPKNVLHHAGIPQTVYDINASIPPTIGIVDGILCMEGDGPILGSPKTMGLIAIGANLPALDATCARIIGLEPQRIPYLALADGNLGPLADRRIKQTGEAWESVAEPFEVLSEPHLIEMLPMERRRAIEVTQNHNEASSQLAVA